VGSTPIGSSPPSSPFAGRIFFYSARDRSGEVAASYSGNLDWRSFARLGRSAVGNDAKNVQGPSGMVEVEIADTLARPTAPRTPSIAFWVKNPES
jgi:hypothetical protein